MQSRRRPTAKRSDPVLMDIKRMEVEGGIMSVKTELNGKKFRVGQVRIQRTLLNYYSRLNSSESRKLSALVKTTVPLKNVQY